MASSFDRVSGRDWGELLILVLIWGSAFAAIDIAVAVLDPWWLTAIRINLGTLMLLALLIGRGQRLPRDRYHWGWFMWLGAVGNVAPFALISFGQQFLASSLAGILMAAMPLMVIVLAHYLLPDEPLTFSKTFGFALGFVGVICLIDPGAILDLSFDRARAVAQGAVLLAAACYAFNGVTVRRMRPLPGLSLATGVMVAASLQSLVLALWLAPIPTSTTSAATFALIALAIFPTALGAAIVYPLISRAGAGFVALSNYLVPICALLIGLIFLNETLAWLDYAGLALILSGVALSRIPVMRSVGDAAGGDKIR